MIECLHEKSDSRKNEGRQFAMLGHRLSALMFSNQVVLIGFRLSPFTLGFFSAVAGVSAG
jgi:hypothetical protein